VDVNNNEPWPEGQDREEETKRYQSDLTDEQWISAVEPFMPKAG
jgi:hypothetical protein